MSSPAAEQPWTIGRLLDWTARRFAETGTDSPRLDAEVLLSHALGCKKIELYTRYDEPALDDARARFRELVQKRLAGCPVAYLVGRKEFYSLAFEVGPAVLIPRPDSELVVLECLSTIESSAAPRVLDVGTGSGNLAVTIAVRQPKAAVTAIDVSADALEVAQRNAVTHGVAGRVRFSQGDLFAPLEAGERFDVIVSNPPYIAREELASLPAGVRNFEPTLALDGGPGGFEVFQRLIEGASSRLVPGGTLLVEIGSPQEASARQRIETLGTFDLAPTIFDYSRHPRVLKARRR